MNNNGLKQLRLKMPVCHACLEELGELLRTSGGYFYYFNKKYQFPYIPKQMSDMKQCFWCSTYTNMSYKRIPEEGTKGLYINEKGWQPPLPGMEFAGSFKVE